MDGRRRSIMEFEVSMMQSLDEGCVARILSLTTPRDACRSAVVSSAFRSASESDTVWENFLPPDYREIINRADESTALSQLASRKQLYFRLCNPILIDGGKKTIVLERLSGKICYMISARELGICWGEDERYWSWVQRSDSRFAEVAELRSVCWLDISGRINCRALSHRTMYGAYLVYKLNFSARNLQSLHASVTVGATVSEKEVSLRYNRPYMWGIDYNFEHEALEEAAEEETPTREDGWLEVELGEFFNDEGEDGVVVLRLKNHTGDWKLGIIVQGIEVRPK